MEAEAPLITRHPLSQLKHLVYQFAPYEFSRYEWKLFDSFKNFAAIGILIAAMEVRDELADWETERCGYIVTSYLSAPVC